MKLRVSEVLDNYVKLTLTKNSQEKALYLRQNYSPALVYSLRALFNSNIQFLVDKIPRYKKDDTNLEYNNLDAQIRKIYLFEKNNPQRNPNLTNERMYELLIQILESLPKRDSELYEAILLKNVTHIPYLTAEIAELAFPGKIL